LCFAAVIIVGAGLLAMRSLRGPSLQVAPNIAPPPSVSSVIDLSEDDAKEGGSQQ